MYRAVQLGGPSTDYRSLLGACHSPSAHFASAASARPPCADRSPAGKAIKMEGNFIYMRPGYPLSTGVILHPYCILQPGDKMESDTRM
jgi:hypothetical protein